MRPRNPVADAARIRARLAELDAERTALTRELVQLTRRPTERMPNGEASMVTSASPATDKIALFRSLFAGRVDVFRDAGTMREAGSPDTRRVTARLATRSRDLERRPPRRNGCGRKQRALLLPPDLGRFPSISSPRAAVK